MPECVAEGAVEPEDTDPVVAAVGDVQTRNLATTVDVQVVRMPHLS